jgi:hypothetical protein
MHGRIIRPVPPEYLVLTIESVKCRICGTKHAAEAATCPVCGAKTRPASSTGKASAGKAKPEPFGLDPATLLAKIDALDWEEPTVQPASATAPQSPAKRSLLLPFLIGFVILLTGTLALRYYSGGRTAPVPPVASPEPPTPAVAVAAQTETAPVPAVPGAADQQTAPALADGQPAVALGPEEAEKARLEEARRKKAELKRKALAAKQALEEKTRLERTEQEKLRAEREAAEARARAAVVVAPPAPKGPSSPREVCAGEQNVFSRGACEARVCAESQWRSHPFCVKRWQDELRKLSPSGEG